MDLMTSILLDLFVSLFINDQVLQDRELYAKFSRCEFLLDFVALLGIIVPDACIAVDTQKFKAVKTWRRPMTPTEVHSFLG